MGTNLAHNSEIHKNFKIQSIVETNSGKLYTSYTHIHDRSFFSLGTGTSIKKTKWRS